MACVAPAVTVISCSTSYVRPYSAATFSAMASRSGAAPAISAYWLAPACMCFATSSNSAGGAEKSGKPCDRLMAPCCAARRDMTLKMVVPTRGRRESMGAGKVGMGGIVPWHPQPLR